MAIIGGAGNPVGGSFTGPAEALEVIGDHAYAYSGALTAAGADEADTTAFNFTTGNYYSVLNLSALTGFTGNEDRYVEVSMNGTVIISVKADASPDFYNVFPLEMIIPTYTDILVKFGVSGGGIFNLAFSGRIYRTTD